MIAKGSRDGVFELAAATAAGHGGRGFGFGWTILAGRCTAASAGGRDSVGNIGSESCRLVCDWVFGGLAGRARPARAVLAGFPDRGGAGWAHDLFVADARMPAVFAHRPDVAHAGVSGDDLGVGIVVGLAGCTHLGLVARAVLK